ncbi:MAG: TolC family protein [bacterium]
MTLHTLKGATSCRLAFTRLARVRNLTTLIAGVGLAGCTGVLPNSSYQPVSPPPFTSISERIVVPLSERNDTQNAQAHSLEQWVIYALERNPRITVAIAQYEAATQKVPQVTALPDPKLSYRYFLEEVETRVGAQQYAVGISQPLPWVGKLRLQGQMASQAAQAAAARVSTIQNEVISEVASAWYELFYFDRALQIMRGNRDLVVHLERVARTRYGTGASGHPDVIRAQVELGKIENDLASLADREAPLLARLNAVLNRPSGAPIELPKEAPFDRGMQPDETIIQRVITNNPELQALRLDIAQATTAKERAKKDFLPDFSFGIDYIATDEARAPNVAGSGNDPLSAAFTMTLPIQRGKYRAGVQAADARIAGEIARRDQQLNSLEAETVNALFRLRDAERQIDLYRTTLLPKANESLISTQRAYSSGRSTFADLIDAQRVLLVFELAEVRAVTDHNLARTALEELMGEPLISGAAVKETTNEQ